MIQNEAIKSKKMTESQMRLDLEQDIADLKSRAGVINTEKIVSQSNIQQTRNEIIKTFFNLMREYGVDPSDIESINKFLQTLEQQDPDLAELFVKSFQGLTEQPTMVGSLPEQTMGAPTVAAPTSEPVKDNSGMMSKFNNLSGQVMGR